jgi:sigma-B regulation protein RsbU (phosphoserine phosphatase)
MLARLQAEQENRVAGMVQELVIPRSLPTLPGWDLAFYHQQSLTGERDFCDVWLRPDGCLMLALGEVSDRGLQAAHIISSTRAILRGTAQRTMSPDEALECSNELLAPDVDADLALACLYALLDPASGQLTFASAGFPWPCICLDGMDDSSATPGVLLGQDFAAQFESHEVVIPSDGCAVLFSNGLSEAANAEGEPFGRRRISEALREPSDDARDVVETVLAALRAFTGRSREQQADDITMIVLKCLPQPGRSDAASRA